MTEPPVRVIVVDDDPQVQADLEDMLEPLGYDVRAAGGRGEELIRESKLVAKRFRFPGALGIAGNRFLFGGQNRFQHLSVSLGGGYGGRFGSWFPA